MNNFVCSYNFLLNEIFFFKGFCILSIKSLSSFSAHLSAQVVSASSFLRVQLLASGPRKTSSWVRNELLVDSPRWLPFTEDAKTKLIRKRFSHLVNNLLHLIVFATNYSIPVWKLLKGDRDSRDPDADSEMQNEIGDRNWFDIIFNFSLFLKSTNLHAAEGCEWTKTKITTTTGTIMIMMMTLRWVTQSERPTWTISCTPSSDSTPWRWVKHAL